jgi:hypothetical protein
MYVKLKKPHSELREGLAYHATLVGSNPNQLCVNGFLVPREALEVAPQRLVESEFRLARERIARQF